MRYARITTPVAILLTSLCQSGPGHTAPLSVTTLAEGLEYPWSLTFLPDRRALVSERPGRLRLVSPAGEVSAPLTGLPALVSRGQGGLLGLAIDPAFTTNRYLYFCYVGERDGFTGSEVARARLNGMQLSDVTTLFIAQPKVASDHHFGCRLAIRGKDELFISLGERYHRRDDAQDPGNHLGTIARIRTDGRIPSGQPFRDGAAPEVFSYGHRNVQGLAIHPTSGALWAHEHGPKGGDEVNVVSLGHNYGWPAVTFGVDYSGAIISDKTQAPGVTDPVTVWVPSIAPSGMAFYDHPAVPEWKGNLFIGALRGMHLRRLMLDGETVIAQESLLDDRGERIRDVTVGPDGALYVLTDAPKGKILRVLPGR